MEYSRVFEVSDLHFRYNYAEEMIEVLSDYDQTLLDRFFMSADVFENPITRDQVLNAYAFFLSKKSIA